MTPSVHVKKYGLTGLQQMADISNRSTSTLKDLFKNNPAGFDTLMFGCIAISRKPYTFWLIPEALLALKYEGPAVAKTKKNNRVYAVKVTKFGFFHINDSRPLATPDIAAVMAYRED